MTEKSHYTTGTVHAEITSVTNLATLKQITVEAPSGWSVVFGGAGMFRPGDRFVCQTAAALFKGSGTIDKVVSYTDDSTAVVLQVSHDMAERSLAVGDFIQTQSESATACGIEALSRTVDHFGG